MDIFRLTPVWLMQSLFQDALNLHRSYGMSSILQSRDRIFNRKPTLRAMKIMQQRFSSWIRTADEEFARSALVRRRGCSTGLLCVVNLILSTGPLASLSERFICLVF